MSLKSIKTPLFPYKLTIDSKITERIFKKQNLKYPINIEVNKEADMRRRHVKTNSQVLKKLLKSVVKKSKFLKGANLVEFPFSNFRKSVLIQTIKYFYRTKALTLFWKNNEANMISINTQWLKHSKHLKTLKLNSSEANTYSYYHNDKKDKVNSLMQTHFRTMKRKRLSKFKHLFAAGPNEETLNLMISNFNSSIRELTLSWDKDSYNFDLNRALQNYSSFSKMTSLQKLELLFPANLQLINSLLSNIPNPKEISCLGLQIEDKAMQTVKPSVEDITKFTNFLNKCTELEHLNLKFSIWIDIFSDFNILQSAKLKSLELNIQIDEEKHYIILGSFLRKLTNLEKLTILILNSSWADIFLNGFVTFNNDIAQLNNLNKLDIWCWLLGSTQSSKVPQIMTILANSIRSLKQLEELDLRNTEIDYENELGVFVQCLKEKSSQLKRLRLEFKDQKLKEQDLVDFAKTIQKCEKLEELDLKGLRIESSECFELFLKALSVAKKLKVLNLRNLSIPETEPINIISMLKNVLTRKGFERILFEANWGSKASERFKDYQLIFGEIFKKNHQLKSVSIPVFMFQDVKYASQLNEFKWKEENDSVLKIF